jgi:DNA-binding transcriptional LysR family regulator
MTRATNFHQLYIFHTVSRLGSFSKAADELAISQPAVSIQVKELEKSLGCALLHRMRRGLQLTDTGHAVYSYTQRIFSLAEEMQSAIQDIQGLKTGRLTIGSSTTPGEYILPWVIGKFRLRYPGVEVSLSITNTKSIVQRILDHEFDLGMAGAPVNIQGLTCFQYVNDDIVIIAPTSHPLSSRDNLTIDDLRGQQFVLREEGSATRQSAENCLNQHNLIPHVAMELGSNEAVKRAVSAGLGLGVISKFAVVPDVIAGFVKVLNVENWKCRRPLTVFYRDDTHLPAAQHAFLRFLQEEKPLPEIPAHI